MRNTLYFILIVCVFGCASTKKLSLDRIKNAQQEEETLAIISALSSDEFLGREPGTKGYALTSAFVERFLKENRLKPFFRESYKDTVLVNELVSANIVALIGKHDKTKEHILIGAHLDHLGLSGDEEDSVYNGANDNASGVTAVLQLAKTLNRYKFEKNIIVALFTGEESGLVGSRHLAERLKEEKVNLTYMLNYEMIGKTLSTGPNQVYITGYDKSNCQEEMNEIDKGFVKFLPAEISYNLFRRSDNYAFYEVFGIPSHTISTFDFENYKHYHKVSDEVGLLDIKNMTAVINTSTFIISQFLVKNVVLENKKEH